MASTKSAPRLVDFDTTNLMVHANIGSDYLIERAGLLAGDGECSVVIWEFPGGHYLPFNQSSIYHYSANHRINSNPLPILIMFIIFVLIYTCEGGGKDSEIQKCHNSHIVYTMKLYPCF